MKYHKENISGSMILQHDARIQDTDPCILQEGLRSGSMIFQDVTYPRYESMILQDRSKIRIHDLQDGTKIRIHDLTGQIQNQIHDHTERIQDFTFNHHI